MEAGSLLVRPWHLFSFRASWIQSTSLWFTHLLQSLNVVSQVSHIKPLSISLLHYVCHTPSISHLLLIIIMIILGEEFTSTVSMLYLFLQRHINSSLLLNNLDLRSSLHVRNHFSTNTRKAKFQIAMPILFIVPYYMEIIIMQFNQNRFHTPNFCRDWNLIVNIITFFQFPTCCGTMDNRNIFTQPLTFSVNDYTSFIGFGIVLFVQLMSIINVYVGM